MHCNVFDVVFACINETLYAHSAMQCYLKIWAFVWLYMFATNTKMGCASSRFTIQQYTIHAQIMQTCLLYIEIHCDIKEVKI